MAAPRASTPQTSAVPPTVTQMKQEGLILINPLRRQVQSLTITDEVSYLRADTLLGRVALARKTWAGKMAPILVPLKKAITEAKKAMEGAKSLDAEVDGPLAQMESDLKGQMRDYKIEEARLIQEAQDKEAAQIAETNRLLAEAAEADRVAVTANKSAPMKARLAKARADALVEQAETIQAAAEPAPEAVKGTSSSTRTTPSWRIIDKAAFVKGVAAGKIPLEAVEVWNAAVNKQFRDDPAMMKWWPGVELYDEVTIVRR